MPCSGPPTTFSPSSVNRSWKKWKTKKIAAILAFSKKNGCVKTSSFNVHLSDLGIYGDNRRGTLDCLTLLGYIERTKPSGGVYLWRITPSGEDFLRRAGVSE